MKKYPKGESFFVVPAGNKRIWFISKEYKKQFKQSWADNMSKAGDAKVKDFDGSDFTRVTFQPDLTKFNMESMNDDTVALLSR